MYKIYCKVLLTRLEKWVEANFILTDEQNGFRKNRSCIDQLSTLTLILQSRLHTRRDTYTAFIDSSKAYDRVVRTKLWNKLWIKGISRKYIVALQSLYDGVECCVKVNGRLSQWFEVQCGLKQGCLMSPLLFNLYINDLLEEITQLETGVDIGQTSVSVIVYADDIVLLTKSAEDLQSMMETLHAWSVKNSMVVNLEKSKVIHFHKVSKPQTTFPFMYNGEPMEVVKSYKYLGLILTETLDFNITAKNVAASASRSLGLLIAKSRTLGGIP